MGYLAALSMTEATDLDTALGWHLAHNHYPPVPNEMVGPCRQAIEAIQDEEPQKSIDLPQGTTWQGHDSAPAGVICDQHHLDAFIG